MSPKLRHLPDNTQHSQQTDIYVHCGIRTHNPSKTVAIDTRLRPRDHRDSLVLVLPVSMEYLYVRIFSFVG